MYAMVDREDDERIGVKSTAILFGEADRFIIAVMMAMTLLALWLAGKEAGLGVWYRGGLAAAAILFLHELWLIRRRKPEACFRAFNNNHYVGWSSSSGLRSTISIAERSAPSVLRRRARDCPDLDAPTARAL
jgi:4-hydroxybenzoate polyprenyltransferase